MKHTHRTLMGVFALMLVLGSVGCGKVQSDAEQTSGLQMTETTASVQVADSTQNTQAELLVAEPLTAVRTLSEVPEKDRPEVSDPAAVAAHGVKMEATYQAPNGVKLCVETLDGAKTGKFKNSTSVRFEQYVGGEWCVVDGLGDEQRGLNTSSFTSPLTCYFAFPHFPEAGVYRCTVSCNEGGIQAEHYAYFEVPEYTLTVPTAEDCPAANTTGETLLTVTVEEATSKNLTLVLKANTETGKAAIEYGEVYRIYCHIDGEWKGVAMHSPEFIGLAYMSGIDGERTFRYDLTKHHYALEPGHYRFEKYYGDATYYAYFEITE